MAFQESHSRFSKKVSSLNNAACFKYYFLNPKPKVASSTSIPAPNYQWEVEKNRERSWVAK